MFQELTRYILLLPSLSASPIFISIAQLQQQSIRCKWVRHLRLRIATFSQSWLQRIWRRIKTFIRRMASFQIVLFTLIQILRLMMEQQDCILGRLYQFGVRRLILVILPSAIYLETQKVELCTSARIQRRLLKIRPLKTIWQLLEVQL